MLNNPLTGAGYLLRGIGLLNRPGVRRYVVVPLFINVALFGALLWLAATQFGTLLDSVMPQLPGWLEWLTTLLWVLFALSFALLLFFTFTLVANLVGGPFNGFLAAAVEQQLTGQAPAGSGRSLAGEVAVAVANELRKLGYFALRAIPLLVLFFIPGLNLLAPVLWMLFGAWMLSLQYCDFPMGNDGLSFAEQRRRLGEKRLLSLGFGAAASVATVIPVVNFLVMPAAVAGATAMWVEQFKGQRPLKR